MQLRKGIYYSYSSYITIISCTTLIRYNTINGQTSPDLRELGANAAMNYHELLYDTGAENPDSGSKTVELKDSLEGTSQAKAEGLRERK